MLRTFSCLILLFFLVSVAAGGDSLGVTEGFHQIEGWNGKKVLATGIACGIIVGSIVDSYYAWWKGSMEPFRFATEGWLGGSARGIDKLGHFYTSYFYFHSLRNVMLWGGYDETIAMWSAVGGAALFAVSIEIGDGFTTLGFDYEDLVFNLGGLGYGLLQTQVPFLRNLNFKWSYIPDDGLRFPPRFSEHYDAHTYWLTANVNELLPQSLEPFWPDVLQLAVGYGVDDNSTRREFVFGLDFDLEILPVENEDLLLLQKTVNMLHVPAPAVKFTEGKPPSYHLLHVN